MEEEKRGWLNIVGQCGEKEAGLAVHCRAMWRKGANLALHCRTMWRKGRGAGFTQ